MLGARLPCLACRPRCEDWVISPSINSKWVVPSVATFHLFPSLSPSLAFTWRLLEVLFVKEKGKPAGSVNTGGVEWSGCSDRFPASLEAPNASLLSSNLSDYLSKC